jgi:hypothetical protein
MPIFPVVEEKIIIEKERKRSRPQPQKSLVTS